MTGSLTVSRGFVLPSFNSSAVASRIRLIRRSPTSFADTLHGVSGLETKHMRIPKRSSMVEALLASTNDLI